MKKLLAVVLVAALALGIGLSIPKAKNQAGDPPVGSPVKVGFVTPDGDPPVG